VIFFKITSSRARKKLSAKNFFTESFFFAENYFFTLGEELSAKSPGVGSRQRLLLSAKALFPVVIQAN
jgi:hypothetical protein